MKGVTMKKKKHHHAKVISLNIQQSILRMLRKDLHLTEEEVELVTRALNQEVPHDVAQRMQDIADGKVNSLKHNVEFEIDMQDGTFMNFSLANHPSILLHEYLNEKYGSEVGLIYWNACTSKSPEVFYRMMNSLKRAPFFADIVTILKNRAKGQGEDTL